MTITKGDLEQALAKSEHIIEGEIRMGGQEHFYLETNAGIAIPREDEIDMISSTQHPTELQKLIAHVLEIPCHKISVR